MVGYKTVIRSKAWKNWSFLLLGSCLSTIPAAGHAVESAHGDVQGALHGSINQLVDEFFKINLLEVINPVVEAQASGGGGPPPAPPAPNPSPTPSPSPGGSSATRPAGVLDLKEIF